MLFARRTHFKVKHSSLKQPWTILPRSDLRHRPYLVFQTCMNFLLLCSTREDHERTMRETSVFCPYSESQWGPTFFQGSSEHLWVPQKKRSDLNSMRAIIYDDRMIHFQANPSLCVMNPSEVNTGTESYVVRQQRWWYNALPCYSRRSDTILPIIWALLCMFHHLTCHFCHIQSYKIYRLWINHTQV